MSVSKPAPTVRIVRPASRERQNLLPERLKTLESAGFRVLYEELPEDPDWTYSSATMEERARQLMAALLDPEVDVVCAARGGYGASDLLPLLDWQGLARAKPKLISGFSDICALQSAVAARLGWPSLHAPMPATTLWTDGSPDVAATLEIWRGIGKSRTIQHTLSVKPLAPGEAKKTLDGPLFGGCFSVLTNLIGTPYFPATLAGRALFLEDTDESPARLMRMWNQWLQSGALDGVKAVVLGYLRKLGDDIPDCADYVYREFAKRSPVPVYQCLDFGHTCPNHPLLIGSAARIAEGRLTWTFEGHEL